jgi:hypothetical protein
VSAWAVGLLAGLSLLAAALDAALGRSAADVAVAAVGLGLVAVGLTRLGRAAWPPGSRDS